MGLLDRLRPGPRRARPVGKNLEYATDDRNARRRTLALKVGIFLALTAITVAAFRHGDGFEVTVPAGDVWLRETLTAPFDFAIYKPPDSLVTERNRVRFTTPPYFRELPDAQGTMSANRDTVMGQLSYIFETYEDFIRAKSRGRLDEAAVDSARYIGFRDHARLKLTAEQWKRLVDDYVAHIPGLPGSTRDPVPGRPLYEDLLQEAWAFSTQLISQGVLDIPLDSIYTDEIIVRNEESNTEQKRRKDEVYGLNEVYTVVRDYFGRLGYDASLINMVNPFVRAIFVPSLQYQRVQTMRAWQEAQRLISPTRGKVARGEEIARQGQRVTEEVRLKLISLDRAQRGRSGPQLSWKRTLGQVLLALATFAIFFLYLFMVRRSIFDDNRQVLLVALLFAGIIGLYAIGVRMGAGVMYAVPVAIVSVVLTVIFDSRVGLFGTLTLALLGGLLLGFDFEFTFATLFGGTLGVFSVRDIKNRGQFFLSAGLVFAGYVVVMGATWLFLDSSVRLLGSDLLMAGINSFLLIIAYPLLWIFERSFNITTDLTLLELSDTNRPLLKELSMRAPGTFNHSLQVANLAEAAAASIDANALLTRVGALYHDIGKMLKPEYFVENQRPGLNPHDQLKPRMSALIIASHVKEGLEMGRQHKIPRLVLDFIPMHHGTTRIEFFYRRALDEHVEERSPLLESEFRYPGPRPGTKETGILMLADGVEAASRSLSDPTHKRLEALIDMIFKQRIEDGQLDDTHLTFRDLNQIKETFLSLLLGIYHIRVKYPEPLEETRRTPDQEAPTRPVLPRAPVQDRERRDEADGGSAEDVGGSHPEEGTDGTPSGNGVSGREEAAEETNPDDRS